MDVFVVSEDCDYEGLRLLCILDHAPESAELDAISKEFGDGRDWLEVEDYSLRSLAEEVV